jgi:hypothetical protein
LFAFEQAAAAVIDRVEIKPGLGPPIGHVPTFLLSGPLAPRAQADEVDRPCGRAGRAQRDGWRR